MQNKSDAQLLREYAAQHSDSAFAEIVARHTDLVYSAALRQTGSPELAREIAQSVFTDLARKARALAGSLSADASLAGWLFRGTRFAGLKWLRDDHRRQTRERQFMEHFNSASHDATESAPDWERVAPVLDEAMAELGDADHEAVLLRYFKNQDFHAVGLALGVSDDTAQKRVSRAVERLREFFAKRGVTVGASGLVVVISANAVQAAPISVAALTSASLAATAAGATTAGTFALAGVAKVPLVLATVLVMAVIGGAMLLKSCSNMPARNEEARMNAPALIPFVPAPGPPKTGLKGVVLLRGAPPAERVITFDPLCGRLHNGPVVTRNYVVGSNGALANVLVYVKAGAPSNFTAGLPPVLLDNTNCLFEPYVSAVLTNQPVVIRNSDAFLHNAHGLPTVNTPFNVALPVPNASITKSFPRPELFVTIKCDVHPWMFAYVCVLDHPWFAVTDANGEFQFPLALPSGTYTLAAVHRKAGEVTQTLVVAPGLTNPPAQFLLDAK